MSENNDQPAETPQEPVQEPQPEQAPEKISASFDLKKEIAQKIADDTPGVRTAVVAALAEEELTKRKEALLKAFKKWEEATKELSVLLRPTKQYKPKGTSGDFEEVECSFDKAQMETIKKKRGEISKIEKAIALALGEKPDYNQVKSLG